MRKIREILRLRFESQCSQELIARSIGIGRTTVRECLDRAKQANLSWPIPETMTDDQLEASLYPKTYKSKEPAEDTGWAAIHTELKRKGVTRMLLWEEYKKQHPQGLSYSQFCYQYSAWQAPLDVWMRQSHKAGEKLFVDYSGQTMPVLVDIQTGEVGEAQIFIATLGASNFTYAEATWTQTLPDWIHSHINAFEFFEGCPEIVVPDNLKSGVSKAHLYEPDLNPTYQDMAVHYGVVICPARAGMPRDKGKVENGVLQVQRHVLAKLRNTTFVSLEALNQAMRPLLNHLNTRPFQKLPGSRLTHFQEFDKPALKPLPACRYAYAEWKKVKAGLNYHIEIGGHYYSVPYTLVKKPLHARYTTRTVEVFYKSNRMASHVRSYVAHGYTTNSLHMPKKHQSYAQWTPERIISWGKQIGNDTSQLCEAVMASRHHPEQGFRACLGIIRLSKGYGSQRLEAACKRALYIGAHSYKSVESILKNNIDQQPLPTSNANKAAVPGSHEYIRGKDYYA